MDCFEPEKPTQRVCHPATTGIYYWTATDQNGKTQIGKFVVMK